MIHLALILREPIFLAPPLIEGHPLCSVAPEKVYAPKASNPSKLRKRQGAFHPGEFFEQVSAFVIVEDPMDKPELTELLKKLMQEDLTRYFGTAKDQIRNRKWHPKIRKKILADQGERIRLETLISMLESLGLVVEIKVSGALEDLYERQSYLDDMKRTTGKSS